MKRIWNTLLIFLNIKAHDWELVLEGPTKVRTSMGYVGVDRDAHALLFRCKLTSKEMAWVVVDQRTEYNISLKEFYRLKLKPATNTGLTK